MTTITRNLNIPRDYIKFKQQGTRLLYSLDNVTWWTAYDFAGLAALSQTPIPNISVMPLTLWKSIQIGDQNGQFPEDMYTELKSGEKSKSLKGCYAIRQILYGLFAGFYTGYAKEWHRNNAVEVTTDKIKNWLRDSPNFAGAGDIGVWAGTLIGEVADEFAGGFDELAISTVSGLFQQIFIPDSEYAINTLTLNELLCDISSALAAAETYATFKTIAGELPDVVYEAWSAFATREIWQIYLFVSRTAPSDVVCQCGDECYSIPPGAMIINNTTSGQPYATRNGDWLEMNTLAWVAPWIPNAIHATTYYPIKDALGRSLKSISFYAKISGGVGSGGMTWRAFGIKMDNTEEVITGANKPLYNDEREYSFVFPENYPPLLKAVRLELKVSGSLGTGSVTEAQHKAMRATLKSVIICLD